MAESKNYIEKEDMMEEIRKSHEKGKPTEKLGEMFMTLCEKYSHNYMFRDYERRYGKAFKQDLLSSGLVACIRAWDKFDMEKFDNPFSFFTTCIFRAYIGYLSKEYNYGNTKNAMKVEVGMRGDYGYEEMIENEEAKPYDEENAVYDEITVGFEKNNEEEEEEDDFGLTEEKEEKSELKEETPKKEKKHKVTNPLLERMTLWGGDEELENDEDGDVNSIDSVFGIGEKK